jgi:predicted Zn finger-like uncharacterized protein
MIVQCEICQTKYNIEDSKITPQGVRVRCAKCKHIFSAKPSSLPPPPPPPPPTPEPVGDDFLQDFESFEKFHKDLLDTPGLEAERPQEEGSPLERGEFDQIFREQAPSPEVSKAEEFPTEEWPGPFPEEGRQAGFTGGDMETPTFDMSGLEEGLKEREYPERPLRTRAKRKTSWSFVVIGILIILAMGGYYLWSERGVKLSIPWDISSFFSAIPERVQSLVDSIRGIERGSLSFSDLEGYKDTIGKVPVFVITGKVLNDTNKTKKHVRIKAVLLNDKNRVLDEKETLCGSYFSKEDLKKLPPRFTRGDFRVRPRSNQMSVAPRTTVPFIVIFPNMPPDANEFQVEIVEAPNA